MMGNMELLWDELLLEILIKVPIKPLYRSKCVCKRWKLLITNPSFVKRLDSLPLHFTGYIYHHRRQDDGASFIASNDIDYNDCIGNFLQRFTLVLASHNGLLLCGEQQETVHPRYRYFVCNPLTKQCVGILGYDTDYLAKNTILYCYDNINNNNNNAESHSRQAEFKVVYFKSYNHSSIDIDTYSSETEEWRLTITPRVFILLFS
ncbi:hypothetical protein IFM89_038452 [Coptis chinensis]|uniref:F-box domain-containing protein n=1 Tax=Coptis chinensis TaxID=261450 RepID=A0A835I7V5_9MAGN|nr:hypothetical protein IFM89_038452 [Coptis chinensis]